MTPMRILRSSRNSRSAYTLVDPTVDITLTAGSWQQNPQAIVDESADVVALSLSLLNEYVASYPSLYTLPILAEAIVPIYRIDAIGNTVPLTLSRDALARIYMGDITWWNDTAIQFTNPSLTLPNQRITIIIDAQPSEIHYIYLTAMAKFNPDFSAVIPTSTDPSYSWPLNKYYAYNWFQGIFGVGSGVINYDGSIAMSAQSIALQMKNNVAQLINKAGATVIASATSVTFAAVELGTSLTLGSTTAADLTDCNSVSGWPISTFTYILLDVINARGTCRSRSALVEFFLNFYESTTITSLLSIREFARVPSIVMDQLDIVNIFGSLVQCRGESAVRSTSSVTRTMAVPTHLKFLANLLVSSYADPEGNIQWELDENTDTVNIERFVNNEVDLTFFNPANVAADLLTALETDDEYYILPAFAFAWTWTYNPQVAWNALLTQPLVLDAPTIELIYFSCILDWSDPRILALNPWLSAAMQNQSVAIQQVLPCALSMNQPGADYLNAIGSQLANSNTSSDVSLCVDNYSMWSAYYTCTNMPQYGLRYVQDEAVTASLVVGTWSSMGLMMASKDPVYVTPLMQVTDSHGNKVNTSPNVAGMLACASDTFDPTSLSFDFDASANSSCYPWTQQFVVAFRKTYASAATTSQSCTRGLDALQFLSWIYSNKEIDAIIESLNIARFAKDPVVSARYTSLLNGVLCDDTTLLITLPIEWQLSSGLQVFGYVAAVVGVMMTIVLIGFIIRYHRHPIVRAASPLFMLLSLFGVLLLFCGAVALVAPVTNDSCTALSWLINLGLMITFAPLFAKTWRIYRIFGRRKLSVVKISNRKLMAITAALLTTEIIIMIVWQAMSPIQPYTVTNLEGSPQREHHYQQCGTSGSGRTLFAVAGIEKGLLLVFGALMAFSTRRVSSQFNESSQVALAIYNVVFSIGIIAPIIVVINAVGDILSALLLFVLLWIAFFTALILVVPKALHILSATDANGTEAENRSIIGSSKDSSSAFSFLALDVLSTPAICRSYLAALRRHIETVESYYASQQRKHSTNTGGGMTNDASKRIRRSPPQQPSTFLSRSATNSVSQESERTGALSPPLTNGAEMRGTETKQS